MPAVAAMLPDGRRLHLQHGPIDLIIEADGDRREIAAAYKQATRRFENILDELVGELGVLKMEVSPGQKVCAGTVAERMETAVLPFAAHRVSPMAAVAGSVADEILAVMIDGRNLIRAYVNNGGDIAIYLQDDEVFSIASPAGRISIEADRPVRGIATSGRGGRSLSLGIADSVTVLAANAASADAAATLIANAIDLPDSEKVTRVPANELQDDSDLGDRLVVTALAPLSVNEISTAMERGIEAAQAMHDANLIVAVSVLLQGSVRVLDPSATGNNPVFFQPKDD